MKIVYLAISLVIFSLNSFSQSKFIGELSYVRFTDNKVTDSFQLIVAKDYIEKKYTFSLNVLKFDDMVFIKDSGKIYYINNDLRTVLWRDVKDDSWDTTKLTETSTKKDIKGYLCTLFTREDKLYLSQSGENTSHTEKWITKNIEVDYGLRFYTLLHEFGIYEHGLLIENNFLNKSEKGITRFDTKLLRVSWKAGNKMFKLPEGYTYKEYNRENILDLIREQTDKIYTPEKIMELIRERKEKNKSQ